MTRLHAFNREQLLASARGELFGTAAGRLPNDPMLMFDRITDIREDGGPHGKGMVRAELDIRPDLWFFGCHFIGDPVMPGCLGLDAMWQLTGFFLTWLGAPGKGRALAGVLVTALQWAQTWFVAPDGPAIVVRHRDCGTVLSGELACDRCGDRLSGAQVDVTEQVDVTAAESAGIP